MIKFLTFFFSVFCLSAFAQNYTPIYVMNVGSAPVEVEGFAVATFPSGFTQSSGAFDSGTVGGGVGVGATFFVWSFDVGGPPFSVPTGTPYTVTFSSSFPSSLNGTYSGNTGTPLFLTTAGTNALVYTNFTFCANNTLSTPAVATWTYNGSVVKQETLAPGASDCWTTPSIEVIPVAQNFTENTSVVAANAGTTVGSGGDGSSPTINFNPSSGGGNSTTGSGGSTSDGGGGGGVGGGGTNTYTPPPPPPVPAAPTNIVTFSPPSTSNGSASESTLNSGFQLLHGDLLNLQTGQKIVDTDLKNGFFSVTNSLGQIATYTYSNMLIDGQWLPQIYSAITNSHPTNQITLNDTNFPSSFSNYNLEVTQEGISNLLAGTLGLTNDDFDTNVYDSNTLTYSIAASDTNADAAASAAQSALGSDLISTMNNSTNGIVSYLSQTIPDGIEPDLTVTFPFANVTLDLNPVTRFPWFFLFTHALMTWLTIVSFVSGAIKMIYDILHDYAAAQTGHVPNMTGGSGGTGGTPAVES
jgi:hypothetical protein